MIEKFTSQRGPTQEAASQHIELTAQDTAQLLFWSFYYSQGNVDLQNNVLKYIATSNQNMRLSASVTTDTLLNAALPLFANFFTKGPHRGVEPAIARSKIESHYESLRSVLNAPRDDIEIHKMDLMQKIVGQMVQRDFAFMDKRAKFRAEVSESGKRQTSKGPFQGHFSQFVNFVLLGKPAPGPGAYRALMNDVHAQLDNSDLWSRTDQNELISVLQYHNKWHPSEAIDIDAFVRRQNREIGDAQ